MREKKLIVFDLDGTVLGRKSGQISLRTIQALENVGNRGVILATATGRAVSLIPESVRGIRGLRWLISSNGARVSKNSDIPGAKVLIQNEMERELVLETLEVARAFGSAFNLYCQESIVVEERSLEIYESTRKQAELGQRWAGFLRRNAILVPCAPAFLKGSGYQVEKLSCLQDGSLDWDTLCEKLQKTEEMEAILASQYEIEITSRNIDKGSGLAGLESALGIEKDDVLVFGDSRNDISMKSASRYFVAMGDGDSAVFSYADFITASSYQDGVAVFLENYLKQILSEMKI